MATSTLIQKLDGTAFISNISGSPGSYTSQSTPDVSNRSQVETFLVKNATGSGLGTLAITAGDWVTFDRSKSGAERVLCIVRCPVASTLADGVPAVGVALDTVSVTEPTATGAVNQALVRVVVGGYVEVANVTTAVASGVAITAGNVSATAGRASATVASTLAPACGVTLAVAASNVAPVWVLKQF